MNISTAGDTMKTTIIAENHAVRQAIESNLSQLKDSLSQQGLTVESFDVLVGGDPSFKGQNQQQPNKEKSNGFAANDLLNEEALEQIHLENAPPVFLGEGTLSLFA
jgi:flagellar hook-length control protein FliK